MKDVGAKALNNEYAFCEEEAEICELLRLVSSISEPSLIV